MTISEAFKYLGSVISQDQSKNCLKFTAVQANSTVALTAVGAPAGLNFSIKKSTTNIWQSYTLGQVITLANVGDYFVIKGQWNSSNRTFNTTNYYKFVMTGKISASDNLFSLFNNITTLYQYQCYNLFNGCSSLITAPELPVVNISYQCYAGMFQNCTNLSAAPELSATTLQMACYYNMFNGCTNLITGPSILPATSVQSKNSCYNSMFYNCQNMQNTPKIMASGCSDYCYQGMFYNCKKITQRPCSSLNSDTTNTACYSNMFNGCTSLSSAPELPATILANSCYNSMFNGCTGLKHGPSVLPATETKQICYYAMFYNCQNMQNTPKIAASGLAQYCYGYMFYNCKKITQRPCIQLYAVSAEQNCCLSMFHSCLSLSSVPQLPATTLAYQCYNSMFFGCTSLSSAPELPATTLAEKCYYFMFYGCTNLINGPTVLSGTESKPYCYYGMFTGCQNMINTPKIVASGLSEYCYYGMFQDCKKITQSPSQQFYAISAQTKCCYYMFGGCTSLSSAPELFATTLANSCYANMFINCINLNYVSVRFTDWNSAANATTNWLSNVKSTGTFIKPAALSTIYGVSNIPVNWTIQEPMVQQNLKFINTTSQDKYISFDSVQAAQDEHIQYSINGGAWQVYEYQVLLPANSYVEFKNTDISEFPSYGDSSNNISIYDDQSESQPGIEIEGNLESLWNFETKNLSEKVYINGLFSSNSLITKCSKNLLKNIQLFDNGQDKPGCFESMFYNCQNLVSIPNLPAATLTRKCYNWMFRYCTSLSSTMEVLPALSTAPNCYDQMFAYCNNLSAGPALCATTLADSCYASMFRNCPKLTDAPVLPATTLVEDCYRQMFYNCSLLSCVQVKFMAFDDNNLYTFHWLGNVASSGYFICPNGFTITRRDNHTVPVGWAILQEGYDYIIPQKIENGQLTLDAGNITYNSSDTSVTIDKNTKIVYDDKTLTL